MVEKDRIWALFNELYKNVQNADLIFNIEPKPLLAHYTSIQTIEKIIVSEELWLSNPLFMNDTEELQFGLVRGTQLFQQSKIVDEVCGKHKGELAKQILTECFIEYDKTHALNVFVFCLSEHQNNDYDGKLSMWRAYGQSSQLKPFEHDKAV